MGGSGGSGDWPFHEKSGQNRSTTPIKHRLKGLSKDMLQSSLKRLDESGQEENAYWQRFSHV